MHTWIDLQEGDSLDQLEAVLDDKFAPQEAIDLLDGKLTPQCRYILVEHEYVDKDYRSTYYGFYAKKGRRYDPNCVRLHFFNRDVQLTDDLRLKLVTDKDGEAYHTPLEEQRALSLLYYGYMVLRPTYFSSIGRTILSPSLFEGFHGLVIESWHTVHVLGHRLEFQGFPWMQQHTDISVCAHVACWSILRHYSARFTKYAEHLTYDITRMAQQFDPGGMVPSKGLGFTEAERIFHAAGTYPVMELGPDIADVASRNRFMRELAAYIESGFPVYLELPVHAVVAVGRTHYGVLSPDSGEDIQYSWAATAELVVVDDNELPYTLMSRDMSRGSSYSYSMDGITSFIVALPEKFFYSANAVERLARVCINHPAHGFDFTKVGKVVVRYFATTTAAYRRFIHEKRSQFPSEVIQWAMNLTMPQFVWVIEISTLVDWERGNVTARVIVDATASTRDDEPIFMIYDQTKMWVCDRGVTSDDFQFNFTKPAPGGLSPMDVNLVAH